LTPGPGEAGLLYTRFNPVLSDAGLSCSPPLPACGDPSAIDVADIVADLADPDVERALATTVPAIYGDRSIADADSFSVSTANGRGFGIVIGEECTVASPTCLPTPPGIHRLVSDLQSLLAAALQDPSCAALR
jgi:hypothetical protein